MGEGGGETWGKGGAQKCVGPVLVFLEGQCGHLWHCNPEKKVLTNYKKNLQASSLQRWKCWLFFTLGHFPKIHPNQLLWLSWQLGKYQWCSGMGIMTRVKLGASSHPGVWKMGWMQLSCNIIFSQQIQKKKKMIEALLMLSLLQIFDSPWFFDGRWVANWLPSSQPQPKEIQSGISRHQFDIHH